MVKTGFNLPTGPYLLSHSVGCLPKLAQTTLTENYLQPWSTSGGDAWSNWLGVLDAFCEELGSVIGGHGTDICPQPSVSAAFSNYLLSIPETERRTIVMHADAFPTMGFVVQALERCGFALRLIDAETPADEPAAWTPYLTSDVAAAVITHVHSSTGVVSPVAEIASLCRQRGITSIVDIAQSVGIVPVDVTSWHADVVLGSSVKWLCGGPGAGFIWIASDHINSLQPVNAGWFSHADPFEFDIRAFRFAAGTRKFWGGTPTVAPYALALGSLRALDAIGFTRIAAHNRALKKLVFDGLPDTDWLARKAVDLGGTLCLKPDETICTNVSKALTEAGCHFDQRGPVIRLSFHIYNDEDDARLVRQILDQSIR